MTNTFHSWNTTKTGDMFRAVVVEITTRETPNERGHYADQTVVQTALFPSRARAKGWAQKWVRHYNSKTAR